MGKFSEKVLSSELCINPDDVNWDVDLLSHIDFFFFYV